MSGHSKWSTIKHKKAAQDTKRGKLFTKLIKEITIASRLGGNGVEMNPRLRTAVANARSQSMPMDNIQRAIKKGSGELAGENYEEIVYEGYGPHNVAIIVEAMTDNRKRTIASVRYAFSKWGGNLGATNSVQYMFNRVGSIRIAKRTIEEDSLIEMTLDAGAEDIHTENEEEFEIITKSADFDQVRSFLEKKEVSMISAGVIWNPQNWIVIDELQKAEQVIKLIDLLEDNDDIQSVHSNLDISEKVLAKFA